MPDFNDLDRAEFLQALDNSGATVTDWEARFLESNLDTTTFTEPQREAIDQMIAAHSRRINWS